MEILGIDPGRKGAFVLISSSGAYKAHWDMPTKANRIQPQPLLQVLNEISQVSKPFVVIEKPHSRPTDARNAIATYHWESGQLMMIVALGWPFMLVEPSVWTKSLHRGIDAKLSAKRKSLQAFRNLYPDLATNPDFVDEQKVYDGRIDALLIAEYGRRLRNGA